MFSVPDNIKTLTGRMINFVWEIGILCDTNKLFLIQPHKPAGMSLIKVQVQVSAVQFNAANVFSPSPSPERLYLGYLWIYPKTEEQKSILQWHWHSPYAPDRKSVV